VSSYFADKEAVYLHLHRTVADTLEAALRASLERTADEPARRLRLRDFVRTRLEVAAAEPTFLAQALVEPQVPTPGAARARRDAARRSLLPDHVAYAGMTAGVAAINAQAPNGAKAVRSLEEQLTDVWIRLLRGP
jgi:hypothetical protein